VRLSGVVAAITRKTGMGQAFGGMLLLGGITTLPELATTSSAAAIGAADLALNNVFGSAAFNILLLAVADAVLGRDALTCVVAKPATLMQGVLGMMLLACAIVAIQLGDPAIGPVGLASLLLFALCIAALAQASAYERRPGWQAIALPEPRPEAPPPPEAGHPLSRLLLRLLGLALLVLAGGVLLAGAGESIATRTGAGEGLVGLVLLAIATSLPELSTVTSAIRRGYHELAVGDIFGANLFNIAMILTIDLWSPGPPVLAGAGSFETVAAALALLLTGIFLIGLLERRDRVLLRMGYDSIAALLVYAAGVALLARLPD